MIDNGNHCRLLVLWAFAFLSLQLEAASGSDSNDSDSSICNDGTYLDRCLSKLPKLVDQSLLRRMPVSEEEVGSLCRGFQVGMQCVNKYSKKCLETSRRRFLERQISGARRVFSSLCNDEAFKSEYLRHTLCLKDTQKNWESCVNQFTELVRDEIHNKNLTNETRVFQTCCAIHGFSRCIYVPGRLKCHKDGALFLLKVAEMSIDQQDHFRDCHRIINHRVCAGCRSRLFASAPLLALAALSGRWLSDVAAF